MKPRSGILAKTARLPVRRSRSAARILLIVSIFLAGHAHAFAVQRLPKHDQALYVSTHGDDGEDGSSPVRALRTISQALSQANAGETVFVEQGTYFEQVVTKRGGAVGAEIVIRSLKGRAVIDGSRLKWAAGTDQNQGLVELRHPFVRMVGITVANSKNTGILLNADNLTIEDCQVANTRLHGISTDTARQTGYSRSGGVMIRNIVVRSNVVERAALSGNSQAISLIADGFLVAGNTVRNSPKEGIDIWLGSRGGDVVGNTVHGLDAAGIYVDGASSVRIHRNVVYNNRSGIGVSSEDVHYSTENIWVFNNLVYDNADSGIFLWDDEHHAGHKGVQDVLIAHNTILNNNHSIYVAGQGNTAQILNNLGYSSGASVYGRRSGSQLRGNVWLPTIIGFVSAGSRNFRLNKRSPAIDRGVLEGPVQDDGGKRALITSDFDGSSRVVGTRPDAGAFEYR